MNDVDIVEWIEDLDQSGSKWARPGFQAALRAVEEHRATVVVVARLTRFARSVLDTHRALERLDAAGGQLVAGDINVDTTTATGRLIRDVLASIAAFELEVSRESWQQAKASAVARGVKIASRPPIGYRFDSAHRLDPDPATAHLIPALFRKRANGWSRKEIVVWWAEQTGHWMHQQTIGDIIRNRSYLGAVTYGDLVNDDAHPALVTRAEFDAAQSVAPSRAPVRHGSLLAGVLVCGGCGRKMVTSSGARLANGEPRRLYRCSKLSKEGLCSAPASVIRSRADEYVEARFLEWAAAEGKGVARTDGLVADDLSVLQASEAELDAYLASELVNVVGERAYLAGARVRQDAVDTARVAYGRSASAHAVEGMRARVADEWPLLGLMDRRRLIASAVERVMVHRVSGRLVVPFADRCELVWR